MDGTQSSADLCFTDAVDLARMIRTRQVSASELVSAFLGQIERFNPKVNAICTLLPDRASRQAESADRALARGEPIGPLHGLPIAVKDLVETEGIRTTFGSPIYRDFVPDRDALHVERLKAAGAIIIGKTNVPEFGAGSQTFNPIFGATRNPYDLTRTSGGSSGGAAAALACGMLPLADGSDMGGSLRNPAGLAWSSLPVAGPMARTVRDVAFLLSVMAGPDPRAPLSIHEPGSIFSRPLERDFSGTRVA
jgi:amidase